MRKISMLFAGGVMLAATSAFAAPYGTAGCGLGSIVFGDSSGIIQTVAATLNATAYSQIFGITSGTSNCTDGGGGESAALDQEAFVKMNYASLMKDTAAGQGEYLSAFSTLLGCDASVQSEFFHHTQANHSRIFASEDPHTTLESAKKVVSEHETLGQTCGRI